MIIIILIIYLAKISCYTFSKPYKVSWACQLNDIDIIKDIEYVKKVFERIPLIVLKNQNINSLEFYNFVKKFDDTHNFKEQIYHPFKKDLLISHVGLRDNTVTSEHSKYNNLWHMDMIGTGKLPCVVSSLHFTNVTSYGGETEFCNLENAYAKISMDEKLYLNKLVSIYDKSNIITDLLLDSNGFRKFNYENKINEIIKQPFIFYPDPKYTKKSILFSPFRFSHFEGFSSEYSWDLLDHLFAKYINIPDNTISIKWSKNDIVLFKNRLLLHSSTPSEIYKDEYRAFKIIFLNTNVPINN